MWSILPVLIALSSASASPIQNTPVLKRDDDDANADNDLSCVVYKFSGENCGRSIGVSDG